MRRWITISLAVVVVVVGSAACGGGSKAAKHTTPTRAATASSELAITIKDFTFSPAPLRAHVGEQIIVRNNDTTAHTVTADDKSFDTGNIDGGGAGTFTVSRSGTFKYHCNIHTYMTGILEIAIR